MTDHIAHHATPKTPVEGQRLDQPAFYVLCKPIPPETRAELIAGVACQ
jgi:hypothetical protein